MTTILLDTNHASELLIGNELLWDRLTADSGGGASLCRPSIGELWYIVHASADAHFSCVGGLIVENWPQA